MSFLAPGYVFAALAIAAMIGALHFIVRRMPRAAVLPTARFVPDTPATTISIAKRPADIPLMLLRMLIVLAAGAALARPVLTPSRGPEARVIVVDVSRSAREAAAIRDSALSIYRDGDALVLFDSSARVVVSGGRDSLRALRSSGRRGNLSAALIAAFRAGSRLRDRADSLQLVIVSPFGREELDAATDTIRAMWPGKARLVRIPVSLTDTIAPDRGLTVAAPADDPLVVTAQIARHAVTGSALIDRGNVDAPVSTAQAIAGPGSGSTSPGDRAVISWPASTRPRFAVPRAKKDTVGGVTTGKEDVVAPFERAWMYPADSMRGASVIARWVDGEPAAIEKPDDAGCTRSVAIPVTPVGDLPVRREFVRFVASVAGRCAWRTALLPADPAAVARLEGSGGLAPRSAFQPMTDARSDLAPWLLALSLLAAVAELFARRRRQSGVASREIGGRTATREPRAA